MVADTGMLSRSEVEEFAQCREGLTPPKAPQTLSTSDSHACKPRQASARVEASSAHREDLPPPIAVSRQRLEALKAAIAQHDLDSRSGKLVSKVEVARAAFHEGQRIRQALEGLPYRFGNGLAVALGLDAAEAAFVVQEVMADEIRQMLMTLASDPEKPND